MKKSAVEWVIDQMFKQGYFDGNKPLSITNLDHLQYQAKEMEKQMVIDILDKREDYLGTQPSIFDYLTNKEWFETYVSKGSDEISKVAENTSFDTNSGIPNVLEISDKDIEKEIKKRYETTQNDAGFRDGVYWCLGQLKSRQ